jgi:hypothetical protein
LDPKINQFFPWIEMVRIWHGTAFLFSPEYNAKPAKHVKRKTAASPSHAGPLRGGKPVGSQPLSGTAARRNCGTKPRSTAGRRRALAGHECLISDGQSDTVQ